MRLTNWLAYALLIQLFGQVLACAEAAPVRAAAPLLSAAARGQLRAEPPSGLTWAGKDSFNVPFELVDNRIFVDVRIEGKGPFKFILDTGGGGAGFSVEAAQKIGARLGREIQGRGAGEKIITAWETSVKEIRIGGLVLRDQDCRVFDFSDARHVFGSQRFDGIIGQPVFARAVVRVDYARRLLTFTKPSRFKYRGAAAPVPFELERFLPIVRGEVDGVAARFGLDTGDRSALTLKSPFVAEYKLREKYAPKFEAVTGFGIGGPIRAQVTRVGVLKFAGFEIRGPVTRLSLQQAGAFAADDVAGNVGGAVLKQFTVTFDYGRRRVFFERNSDYGRQDSYDRSGMWISQAADGKSFEITDVVANGPAADVGLRAGDKILAIDGQRTGQLALIAARAKLRGAARSRVRLLVQTGAGRRAVTVILRDLV